jgi:hypothetical protein
MGIHRHVSPGRATRLIGAGLTAGALLLAPVGVAIATPGIAHAAPPPGDNGGCAQTPGDGGCQTPTPPKVTKQIIRLPFLKVEIKQVEGQKPKIKFVPFPNVHLPLKPTKPASSATAR